MSRAFVKEDGDDPKPRVHFGLPSRRDPGFNAAAALALIEAARDGYTELAEEATGYKWGDPALHPHVQKLLDKETQRPEPEQDRRFIQVARRFLRYRP
jgi:hypothetical protein